jgi:CheY-like chemotaxis protein
MTSPLKSAVLIVEDSEIDRAVYRRFLKSSSLLDCEIQECELGEDALQLLENFRPDIILLDHLLPDFNGIELLEAFALQLETMPSVIMLTGEGSETIAAKAMKLGAKVISWKEDPFQFGLMRISHLGNRGFLSNLFSIPRIAFLVSEIFFR